MVDTHSAAQRVFDIDAGYEHLVGLTLVATYVTMLLGAYTSAVGAGLSCPDWPTCYGTVVPFLHPGIIAESPYSAWQIFAEWAHRGVAMATGLLIFGTALGAWRWRLRPAIARPALLAAVLLPIQVVLGGLTVTQSLQPIVVTSHLAVAVLVLVSLTASSAAAVVSSGRPIDA
ncbi:COX15/CtaA family protein [Haloparvum sp. AD34]